MSRVVELVAERLGLGPGEHVVEAVPAFRQRSPGEPRRRARPSNLLAPALAGAGFGATTGLFPGNRAAPLLGGALGAALGSVLGSAADARRRKEHPAEETDPIPVSCTLVLTNRRFLAVTRDPARGDVRCIVDEPLDALGRVSMTRPTRLGLVLRIVLSVELPGGRPPGVFRLRTNAKVVDRFVVELASRLANGVVDSG